MIAAWALAMVAGPLSAWAQDPSPVKIQFEVENLLPQNAKVLQTQLKVVKGVADCAVAGNKITVTVKPEDQLKLSDIKGVVADLKPVKDEKIAIKFDSFKLEGKVTLSFTVGKNQDRVQGAILSIKTVQSAKQAGDGFECLIKSPDGAKLVDIAKAVGTKTEVISGDTALDASALVKDVVWDGGPKSAAKDKPSTTDPKTGQPPAPKKPGHSCGAGGCKPGG